MRPQSENTAVSLSAALRIVDEAWEEQRRSPFVQRQLGIPLSRLPDLSLAESERRSAIGKKLLRRLDELDQSALPHDVALTLRLVRFRARTWSREADWYWTVIDPLGVGVFGMFLPTAYCGGWLLNPVHSQLASFPLTEPGDADRYLALISDYARLIDQFTARTAGQAERGMRMPKVQVLQARGLLTRLKQGLKKATDITARHSASLQRQDLAREIESRLLSCVDPAFDRALEGLSDTYLQHALDTVGLSQYPGGPQVYAELLKQHTTLDLTPQDVHDRGHDRITQIESQMSAIRTELGFVGDSREFLMHLNQDPRWRANSVEGVAAVFCRYIDRMSCQFSNYFATAPKAHYSVEPLPEALQGSMTYGYYDPPQEGQPEGRYLFNAGHLMKQALCTVGTLTYHELVPGHHLHVATQQENETLQALRRYSFVNAYNEGWAEYAATLAGEIGLYEEPEERYGRLVMDSFLTCRLVVDTGMNALGWSLEQAQDYMRQHSAMSEAEIVSDSVRYSCDIPGQALAYKLGDTHILGLRERMRQALGTQFDLREFHSAILGPGALPMPDLEWHVDYVTHQLCTRELNS